MLMEMQPVARNRHKNVVKNVSQVRKKSLKYNRLYIECRSINIQINHLYPKSRGCMISIVSAYWCILWYNQLIQM